LVREIGFATEAADIMDVDVLAGSDVGDRPAEGDAVLDEELARGDRDQRGLVTEAERLAEYEWVRDTDRAGDDYVAGVEVVQGGGDVVGVVEADEVGSRASSRSAIGSLCHGVCALDRPRLKPSGYPR
jgi:hypothetical protein